MLGDPNEVCTVSPDPVSIKENSTVDLLVATINCGDDVQLTITENPEDAFYLRGTDLIAKRGLDFESLPSVDDALWVRVRCNRTGSRSVNVSVEVFIENVNDNPPNFAQSHYVLQVNELTPVNTSVGLIEATDIDSEPLYYRLESVTNRYLRLENPNTPNILVQNTIDYDSVQKISLVLHVQDTYNISESGEPSFTAVVTITVNVKDIDNRPPWFQPCVRTNLGTAKLCVSSGYRAKVNLTEKEDGPLSLEPGPLYAKDGDRNRSELISYRILRGNEGSIFQIDEETGNISMVKAADIAGPITLTVLASQVTNRDQFAVTQVNIEVLKKSRNPPRFEKERYEGYIYSNSVPESMILRDRTSNRPFRVRARDEDFATGVNPDMRYEVQYSSYVNVTTEGFVLLKRVVKTESFALQIRAMDPSTGEFGTAALSVLVIPAVAVPSPSGAGYRAGDMALLGLVMAAILVLCFIVIGFLISHLKKGGTNLDKITECLVPCLKMARPPGRPKDSLQYTNDGYQGTEGDALRGGPRLPAPVDKRGRGATVPGDRGRAIPLERRWSDRHCGFCGLYANHNHHAKPSPASSPARGGGRGGGGDKDGMRSILAKGGRKEGGKSVWFKENEDASGIEVEIIPDTLGQEEETEEEEEEEEVDMEEVKGGDRSMSSQTEVDGGHGDQEIDGGHGDQESQGESDSAGKEKEG
ncbi:cadherin-related family member 5 isoform X3 [Coregonus clupeaformis]|uniref:cadherin-related family member 5 isoform X3 n=1 Tax=Coregonus clupeaformis TaxID=59861 RepID=UPI001BE0B86E|nr:cadherin-related family member 5 isoform X3 [Coregonus clupeaformis]